MTFEEFQLTRTFCHGLSKVDGLGDLFGSSMPGFIYEYNAHIMLATDSGEWGASAFWLDLEGEMQSSNDLEKLERKLYDWLMDTDDVAR